jgi:hypothetical protein
MYLNLLPLHSFTRWLVLASLLFTLYRAYRGWFGTRLFTTLDDRARHVTATIAQIQLLLGLWLYAVSPLVEHFLHEPTAAMQIRPMRFFGIEHSTMMLVAIVWITITSARAKRKLTDRQKFKTLAIGYTIALLIILSSIPWPFSPFEGRPYWRGF